MPFGRENSFQGSSLLEALRMEQANREAVSMKTQRKSDSLPAAASVSDTLDPTERRLFERALNEAERKYQDIFDNASEGIFQTTPGGSFLIANNALAKMLGFDSPDELIKT